MSKLKPPAAVHGGTRICCLSGNEGWEAPLPGQRCTNRRHGHMSYRKVLAMILQEQMEMVRGIRIEASGDRIVCWIPVAKFVRGRRWRKKMSSCTPVMQLVA